MYLARTSVIVTFVGWNTPYRYTQGSSVRGLRPHGYFAVVETLDHLLYSHLFPHLHFWSTINNILCNKQEYCNKTILRNLYRILIENLRKRGPSLWYSGQGSWLQIQRSGFDSRLYQIFWEVVGLERCSLSLVSTTEELLAIKGSGCGLEIREYGHRDPPRWPRGTLYPQNLAITSPISGGHSVDIVCSWTQATELFIIIILENSR
jgi:hypothetical protein